MTTVGMRATRTARGGEMASLVPPGVVVVEANEIDDVVLLPEEERLVAAAVGKRRREFALGRSCARRAMNDLGWEVRVPILKGSSGEPEWPSAFVGSITHCDGYCGAAVAPSTEIRTLGIDAEVHRALPPGVKERTCTDRELRLLPSGDDVHWPTLVFSIKEAIYKAWRPVTQVWLGFFDVEVTVDPDQRAFTAKVFLRTARTAGLHRLGGRFAITDSHIYAAVAVPARRPASERPAFGEQSDGSSDASPWGPPLSAEQRQAVTSLPLANREGASSGN